MTVVAGTVRRVTAVPGVVGTDRVAITIIVTE
jgi:hypothetical protein